MTTLIECSYLSDIEAYRSGDSLVVMLKNRSVDIGFTSNADEIVINDAEFRSLVDAEDVSLSATERTELMEYLESCAAE